MTGQLLLPNPEMDNESTVSMCGHSDAYKPVPSICYSLQQMCSVQQTFSPFSCGFSCQLTGYLW